MLGVLLETAVDLAQVRLGRAVGDVVAGADREIARLLEQRPVVVHRLHGVQQPVALALEDAPVALQVRAARHGPQGYRRF